MFVRRFAPLALAMTLSSAIVARAADEADTYAPPRYSAESWLDCIYDFYEPEIATSELKTLVSHFDSQKMKHEAARVLADLRARDSYLADVAEARCDIRADDYAQAEALLSAAIAAHPSRPDAFRLRIHLRRLQRDDLGYYSDLNDLIARLDYRDFEHSYSCFERARWLFHLKNYRGAATSASQAIESYVAHWDYMFGSWKEADKNRRDPPAYYYQLRAASYAKLGRGLEAIADYDYCEAHDWLSSEMLLERAECYKQVGLLSKAEIDRLRAKSLAAKEKQAEETRAEKIPVTEPDDARSLEKVPKQPEPNRIDPHAAKPISDREVKIPNRRRY